jgi:hypothetical protein
MAKVDKNIYKYHMMVYAGCGRTNFKNQFVEEYYRVLWNPQQNVYIFQRLNDLSSNVWINRWARLHKKDINFNDIIGKYAIHNTGRFKSIDNLCIPPIWRNSPNPNIKLFKDLKSAQSYINLQRIN